MSLIAVGRVKTAYWSAAQEDYLHRIRHYAALDVVEIKDRIGNGLAAKAVRDKEGDDILEAARQASGEVRPSRASDKVPAIIALTPQGKLLDSPAWAVVLRQLVETYPRPAFVIGGPNGLSEEVLKKSRLQLALSPMTFPHDMARIVFLEQLYRAFTILGGEKYHK